MSSFFVHERALCETDQVGQGTRIWAFAHVMKEVTLGTDCNVCGHAFLESGAVVGDRVTIKNGVAIWDKVTIGNDVFIGPYAVFTNDMNPRVAFKKDPTGFLPTVVGDGASIGANATIVCGVTLGKHCFIGAGAVVIKDVPSHALVVGNPARPVGWMCRCGARLNDDDFNCPACGRQYERGATGLVERLV